MRRRGTIKVPPPMPMNDEMAPIKNASPAPSKNFISRLFYPVTDVIEKNYPHGCDQKYGAKK
jgi:hypothetical protein